MESIFLVRELNDVVHTVESWDGKYFTVCFWFINRVQRRSSENWNYADALRYCDMFILSVT